MDDLRAVVVCAGLLDTECVLHRLDTGGAPAEFRLQVHVSGDRLAGDVAAGDAVGRTDRMGLTGLGLLTQKSQILGVQRSKTHH